MTASSFSVRKGLAIAAIATVMTAALAPDAEARWRRGGHRGAWAAAAIGGLAAGALISAATRPAYGYSYGYSNYGYAPVYSAPTTYYYSQPAYAAPAYATPTYVRPYRAAPVYRRHVAYREPVCTIQRRKVWLGPNTYTFRRSTICR